MRISFDLDDTLICYQTDVPQEQIPPWYRRWAATEEPLRLGTRNLIHEIQRKGHEVWIYTTSHRNPYSVWWWLWAYGIVVGRVINQDIHERTLRKEGESLPSKNPRAFGISWHIDDSEGVRQEGQQFGFSVVVVSPHDREWTQKVLQAIGD